VADNALEQLTALQSFDIGDYETLDMGGAWRLGEKLARLPYLLHLHLRPTPLRYYGEDHSEGRDELTRAFPPQIQVLSWPVTPSDDERDM
jgi:hypothetical protein